MSIWDSSASIVTKLVAAQPGNRGSTFGGRFCLFHSAQTSSYVNSAFFAMGIRSLCGHSLKQTIHFRVFEKLIMVELHLHSPRTSSWRNA
jgi:hypothetical protein